MSNFDAEGGLTKTSNNEEEKISGKKKIIRGVMVFFIVLIIAFFAINLVISYIPIQHPSFSIKSLSISNFNATKNHLSAEWHANFTITNQDHKLELSMSQIDILLTYTNFAIASDLSEPHLKLGPKKQGEIMVNINRNRSKHLEGIPEPFGDLIEAKKNGTLAFKVYMLTTGVVLPGTWWERVIYTNYECDYLRPQFTSETKGVVMFHHHGRPCLIGGI